MPRSREAQQRSDAELVAACRAGDGSAWRVLVHRYRRLVYGIPRSMGLQPVDADEVFQHTFVELLRALPRLHEPDRIEAWPVTTSRRAVLRHLRDESRRHRLAEECAPEDLADRATPGVDDAIERLRAGERVMRVLESLGQPCHGLLAALFSDAPPPYRTLAARLGVPVGSLGPTRARCLERLRARLLRTPASDGAPRVRPAKERS